MLQGARDLTPSHIRKVVVSAFARTLLGSISLTRLFYHVGHRPALVARPQGRRGLPHPARLGRDRRISAQPDPRHDRARDPAPPPARPPGPRISAVGPNQKA